MKRLLSILLVLLLLSAAFVWLAPALVDFTAFRQDIEKQISSATGRDVSIDGDISMRLLPEPALEVHKVSVRNAGQAKSEQAALAVEELRLNAEFWPLLNKQVKLTSVHLVRPEIHLAQLGPATPAAVQPTAEEQDQTDGLIAAVSLDAVKIIDGRISLSADTPPIENINAELHAPSLSGPFSASGSIGMGEVTLVMDLTTGRLGEGQPLALEATFMTQDTLNSFSYNGVINMQGDAGLEGNFQLGVKDPAAFLARAGQSAPAALGMFKSIAARGVIAMSKKSTDLTGLELTLDESKLAGDIHYAPAAGAKKAALKLDLGGDKLDISGLTGDGGKTGESLFKSLDHTELPVLPFDTTAKMAFAGITHKKNSFENVQLELSYKDGALNIEKLTAGLPGKTQLAVKGGIAPEGVREAAVLSNFDMVVDVASDNARALLSAFGLTLPNGLGPDMAFLGRLQGMTNGIKISDAALRSGGSEIVFSGTYTDTAPPRIELSASCKNLKLPEAAAGDKDAKAANIDWLKDYKISFDLRCNEVTRGQATLKNIQLKGTGDASGLRLAEPSGFIVDGVNIRTQGTIGRLSPPGGLDIKLGLKGRDAAAALAGLGIELGDWSRAKLFSDIDLVADFTGDMKNAAFSLKGDLSGIDLQLGGTAEHLTGDDISFDGKVRLQHQDAATAIKILMPDSKPPGKIYGGLDLYTAIKGNRSHLDLGAITGKIGDIAFSGKSAVALDKSPVFLDVALQSTTLDLNKLGISDAAGNGNGGPQGQWSKDKLGRVIPDTLDAKLQLTMDGLVYGKTKFDNVAAAASLKGGALTISQLDANTMGGRMGLTGALAQNADTLNADVDITMSKIQSLQLFKLIGLGDAIDGVGDVTVKLKTAGASEAALVGGINGDVTYLSQGGTLNGVDLERVSNRLEDLTTTGKISAQLLNALDGGQTAYESAQAAIQFKNGVGTIKAGEIVTASGNITGKGRIDLPKWRIDVQSRIKLLRPEGMPPLDMGLTGPLHSPQKSLGTELISQYLADKFSRALEKKFFGTPEQDPNAPANQNGGESQDNKYPLPVNPEDAFKKLLKKL